MRFILLFLGLITLSSQGYSQRDRSLGLASELQDSIGLWNFVMFDIASPYFNNQSLLFSFEHPVAEEFRLSHSLGPIIGVETHNIWDASSALTSLPTSTYGFKAKEELRYLLTNNDWGKNIFLGAAIALDYYRVNNIQDIQWVSQGQDSFTQQYEGNVAHRRTSFLLSVGAIITRTAPFVFDYSLSFGYRNIANTALDGTFTEEAIENLFPFRQKWNYTAQIALRIGFMPKKDKRPYVKGVNPPKLNRWIRRVNMLPPLQRKRVKDRILN